MKKYQNIPEDKIYEIICNDEEKWDNQELGNTEENTKLANVSMEDIQKRIQSKSISIRLPLGVLDDLKEIAKEYEIGYQALIKEILKTNIKKIKMQNK